MIDAREIIESMMTTGADRARDPRSRASVLNRSRDITESDLRFKAREILRLLEDCPDDATVIELREAIQEDFPGVLSGGGV